MISTPGETFKRDVIENNVELALARGEGTRSGSIADRDSTRDPNERLCGWMDGRELRVDMVSEGKVSEGMVSGSRSGKGKFRSGARKFETFLFGRCVKS
nr:hypothetical protein CFP56_64139 [Quercus suber]